MWVPRARTAAEQRAHRGGSGPRRTQRRADRVTAYHEGTWKPAWLTRYIDDRREREAAQQGGVEGDFLEANPGVAQQTVQETATFASNPGQEKQILSEQGDDISSGLISSNEPSEQTDLDPWSGQWRGDDSWWSWTSSWWDGWGEQTSSSSSTTTLPVGDEFLPNQAFFPVIQRIGTTHAPRRWSARPSDRGH